MKSETEFTDYQFATTGRSTDYGATTSRAIVIRESAWLAGTSETEDHRRRVFFWIGLKSR